MPGVVPKKIEDALTWADSHQSVWLTSFASIGLTNAQATAFKATVLAAEAAFDAAVVARNAAKAATINQTAAIAAMRDEAASLINIIRGYAENTGSMAVYATAQIPPRSAPAPAPAPTPPASVFATVTNDGDGLVSWKSKKINGDFYSVERQTSEDATWETIGTTGTKKFTDFAVPSAVAWVSYRIRSHRGSEASESSEPAVIVFGNQAAA